MQQPPDRSTPRFSPDGMWWWDGVRWVPANQAPAPPPPMVPPSYYMVPPPAGAGWVPSPGLRLFLIVFLVIQAVFMGLLTIAGVAALVAGPDDASTVIFWLVVAGLFVTPTVALVGVLRRSVWARWVALASGIAMSLTCLGSVIGIPIVVSAARAPLGKPTAS